MIALLISGKCGPKYVRATYASLGRINSLKTREIDT
jgi:hypothetical protein